MKKLLMIVVIGFCLITPSQADKDGLVLSIGSEEYYQWIDTEAYK